MPSGIIMQSSSVGATPEAIAEVLEKNGYEPDAPAGQEEAAAPLEPKREDFKSDEDFEKAQDEYEQKAEEAEAEREEKEEEAERKRQERQEERHPRLSRRQRAIEKATKPLEEEIRKLRKDLEAVSGKKPAAAAAEPKVEAPKAPKREDFKTDEEFEDAQFDYRYKLRRAKEQAEEQKQTLNARLEANFKSYQAGVAAFKKEHDDFDELVNKDTVRIPEAAYFAIVDLGEDGARVTYHLAQNPDVIDELAEMTPYRAAIEIGRLADKLAKAKPAAATEKPKPKRTQIPEPVVPVSTAATSSTMTSREAAKNRDFKAFKAAQRRGA